MSHSRVIHHTPHLHLQHHTIPHGELSTSWNLVQGQRRERVRSGFAVQEEEQRIVTFKDAQAAEKHIMREHPDPGYNKFVCLRDGCGKEKVSPQQILDHMGQKEEKGGHSINTKIEKDENLRAVKSSTGGKFRVLRDKASFAWYICVPNQPSPPDSRSPSPTEPNLSVASLSSLPETPESLSTSSSSSSAPESTGRHTGSPEQSVQETCSFAAITQDQVFASPG